METVWVDKGMGSSVLLGCLGSKSIEVRIPRLLREMMLPMPR